MIARLWMNSKQYCQILSEKNLFKRPSWSLNLDENDNRSRFSTSRDLSGSDVAKEVAIFCKETSVTFSEEQAYTVLSVLVKVLRQEKRYSAKSRISQQILLLLGLNKLSRMR